MLRTFKAFLARTRVISSLWSANVGATFLADLSRAEYCSRVRMSAIRQ